LLAAALAALALSFSAPPAAAQTPCWRQIINDWVDDDRIDGRYPLHCYGDAIRHVPADLAQYTSIIEDITTARQQLVRSNSQSARDRTLAGRGQSRTGGAKNPTRNPAASNAAEPRRELFKEAFNKVGPRNADSIPLPLLILAGLALLLIAAGAAGLVSRRLRARKVPA